MLRIVFLGVIIMILVLLIGLLAGAKKKESMFIALFSLSLAFVAIFIFFGAFCYEFGMGVAVSRPSRLGDGVYEVVDTTEYSGATYALLAKTELGQGEFQKSPSLVTFRADEKTRGFLASQYVQVSRDTISVFSFPRSAAPPTAGFPEK